MKAVSMTLRILAIVGAIVAVVAWVLTNGKVATLEDELAQSQDAKESAQSKLSDMEDEVTKLDAKLRTKDSETADEKARSQKLNTQLVQARREVTTLQQENADKKRNIQALKKENSNLKEEIINREVDLPEIDADEVADLKEQIAELEEEVDSMTEKLAEAEEMAMKAKIASGPDEAGDTNGAADGSDIFAPVQPGKKISVLKIDARNGLIVFGNEADGLAKGMEFGVRKDYSRALRVRVSNVTSQYVIGYILPGEAKAKSFNTGDLVEIIQ